MSDRLLIVGGGPAGLATARAFRGAGGHGEVVILSADDRPPYRRPPLTKELLRGEAGEADLPLEEPAWYAANGVRLRLGATVEAVDPGRRVAVLAGGEEVGFRACAICTGSEAVTPPIPGADGPRVLRVRSARDGLRLAAEVRPGRRVAVIGSGFIGCEAAASAAIRGAEVTMVTPEPAPQAERLGDEVGAILAGWLRAEGVDLRPGREVTAIEDGNGAGAVRLLLEGGDALEADVVVLGTGARPLVGLAEGAGITPEEGGVPTDAAMRTTAPGISCAGDPAFALNEAAGRRLRVEHWGEAINQGEVAGAALAGVDARWAVAPGFWSTIGARVLKQVAWGDGWDEVRVEGGSDGFTAWLAREGRLVGVTTHERDDDYERGRALLEGGAAG